MPLSLDAIPVFGSGMGYRPDIAAEMAARAAELDVVGVIAEKDTGRRLGMLEQLAARWPVIPHGISLSIGTMGPIDREYLREIRAVSEVSGAPYYSEHLCFTRAPGLDLGHLAPLWFTAPVLRNTIDRVRQVQEYLGKPLVLENVTYMFEVPDAAMRQTEFFHRVVEATGCGVLLDVANIYTNSVNHGLDADAFLREMPLDHVIHVHTAGGHWNESAEVQVDGHSHPVAEPTWQLLETLVRAARVRTIILEHDTAFPESIDPLLEQVSRARAILRGTPAAGALQPA